MPIGQREKAVAGIVLAACSAAVAYHAVERRSVDPCETDPDTYACAVFAQPEWLKRSVYAGRTALQPAVTTEPAASPDGVDGI